MPSNRLSLSLRVKVGKPRNTPFSCFLHTTLYSSDMAARLCRKSTLNTLSHHRRTAKRTVCKERLFSYCFLHNSTYVRFCQERGDEICDLNSLGVRFCANLLNVTRLKILLVQQRAAVELRGARACRALKILRWRCEKKIGEGK